MDFIPIKRGSEVIKTKSFIWIEVLKPKRPVHGAHASKKADIEGMEDSSFLIVVMKLTAIMFNQLDLVASMTLVGASIKIAGVLIPFKSGPHFTPLLPKQ